MARSIIAAGTEGLLIGTSCQLIVVTRRPIPLLFLLGEILHGTNSHNRRLGAAAIVRGLMQRGSIGLGDSG